MDPLHRTLPPEVLRHLSDLLRHGCNGRFRRRHKVRPWAFQSQRCVKRQKSRRGGPPKEASTASAYCKTRLPKRSGCASSSFPNRSASGSQQTTRSSYRISVRLLPPRSNDLAQRLDASRQSSVFRRVNCPLPTQLTEVRVRSGTGVARRNAVQ